MREPSPESLEAVAGGDPLVATVLRRLRARPVPFGLATLLLGFAVLAAWFLASAASVTPDAAIRGLREFPTGAFGDALLLPVAAGASVAVLRGFASMLDAATADSRSDSFAAPAMRRLAAGVWRWLPAAGSTLLTTWYHGPWLADPAFWEHYLVPERAAALIPATYHAIFMFAAIWWLLALAPRLAAAAAHARAAARSREFDAAFEAASRSAWHAVLLLATSLTGFGAILYAERVGALPPWESPVEGPVALVAGLVPVAWSLLVGFGVAVMRPLSHLRRCH